MFQFNLFPIFKLVFTCRSMTNWTLERLFLMICVLELPILSIMHVCCKLRFVIFPWSYLMTLWGLWNSTWMQNKDMSCFFLLWKDNLLWCLWSVKYVVIYVYSHITLRTLHQKMPINIFENIDTGYFGHTFCVSHWQCIIYLLCALFRLVHNYVKSFKV